MFRRPLYQKLPCTTLFWILDSIVLSHSISSLWSCLACRLPRGSSLHSLLGSMECPVTAGCRKTTSRPEMSVILSCCCRLASSTTSKQHQQPAHTHTMCKHITHTQHFRVDLGCQSALGHEGGEKVLELQRRRHWVEVTRHVLGTGAYTDALCVSKLPAANYTF